MAKKMTFLDRRQSGSLKWDGYSEIFHRDDLLPLWVADMDFEVCKPIQEAINRRQKHSLYGYPVVDTLFYEAIIYWHKARYNTLIKKEWIIPLNGVASAIFAALEAVSQTNDPVMIFTPVYGPFFSIPRTMGRKLIEFDFSISNDGYFLDFEYLENELERQKPKALIFCHPHNPIGKVWTRNELEKLSLLCEKHGCCIISDEIHSDIMYDGIIHTPFYDIKNNFFISLYAPTKSFNIPGLNIAYAVVDLESVREKFHRFAQNMHITLPGSFGLEALKAAYFNGEEWLEDLLKQLRQNRKIVCNFFEFTDYAKFYKPSATYLGWIDFSPSKYDAKSIKRKLLDEAKVGLSGGDFFFGGKPSTFHRINFATSPEILKIALEKIKNSFTN